VLIVGGPTASGKTAFAIALAQRYGAEIVGADSRQLYRDMRVGTAAPSPAQMARVPHHLLDPFERYSAARFAAAAVAAIADIHARGKHAIVAGGTGFYLRALCGEVGWAAEPDPALRARMLRETRQHPADVLHAWLVTRDPRRAAAVSPNDPYRIARALEIARASATVPATGSVRDDTSGSSLTRATIGPPTLPAAGIPFAKIALRVSPQALTRRIAERTDAMLAGGLLEEAERIGPDAVAADAVGYREARAYLNGWMTFDELRVALARATRRYAKRQMTWFRAEPGVTWIEPDDMDAADAAVVALGWRPS
jgi:tRNA dimethylallyltransferase